jgi:hypothetical protein
MYLKSILCSILFLVPTVAKIDSVADKARMVGGVGAPVEPGAPVQLDDAAAAVGRIPTNENINSAIKSTPKTRYNRQQRFRRGENLTRYRNDDQRMRRSRFDEMSAREYEARYGHPRARGYRHAHHHHDDYYHDSYHRHTVPVSYMPVTYVPMMNGGCGTAPCGFGGCNEAPACPPDVPEERIQVSKDIDDRYEYNGEKLTCTKSCEGTWPYLSGQFGIVTNYVYRGISTTVNRPAIQGGFRASQAIDSGFYLGLWGSNVESNLVSVACLNGNGLELAYFGGYTYKYNPDLTLNIETKYTTYPRSYYPLSQNPRFNTFAGNNENFDMLEFIPGLNYKWLTFYVAIQHSNVRGLTPNLTQRLFTAPTANGNTKGSLYFYGKATVPLTLDSWNFVTKVWVGYWKIRNYSQLSYAHYGVGLSYTLPKCYKELVLSLNLEGSSAKRRFYTTTDLTLKQINNVGTKLTFGVEKAF